MGLLFTPFFSPMRNASAKSLEIRAPFNNYLPAQTNDVMVNPLNPENPDSKIVAASTKMHPCQGKVLWAII